MPKKTLIIIIIVIVICSIAASAVGFYIAKNAFLKAETDQASVTTALNSSTAETSLPFTQEKNNLDKIAPEIVSVSPVEGAQGVSDDSPILIKFSKAIDETTINPSTIYIYEQKNQTLLNNLLNFSYNNLNNSLTIVFTNPSNNWGIANTVSVTVTNGILDMFGNRLKEAKTWQFSIE